MHELRTLFDAMDQDWLIATYVTAAFLFTVWIVCQVIQLAWFHLEPHVYLWLHFRKESESGIPLSSDPARPRRLVPRSESPVGRVAQRATAADLANRISRRSLELADLTSRPMWHADAADRQSRVGMNGNDAA